MHCRASYFWLAPERRPRCETTPDSLVLLRTRYQLPRGPPGPASRVCARAARSYSPCREAFLLSWNWGEWRLMDVKAWNSQVRLGFFASC